MLSPSIMSDSLQPNGFPGGSGSKESAWNAGDLGSIPGLGRSPGGKSGNPLQYSCLENPCGQRSLAGHSPRGLKESDTTEGLSTASTDSSLHGDSPGNNTGVGCHSLLQGIFPTQDQTQVSLIASWFFTSWTTRGAIIKQTKRIQNFLWWPYGLKVRGKRFFYKFIKQVL